jgi:hypothetical protein
VGGPIEELAAIVGVKVRHPNGHRPFQFPTLVENDLLAKTDKDSRDDFQHGYDFTDAFRKPFWPQGKATTETKPVAG